MKITGIDIGEYRQFKNIKFDFTYPEGHEKAGQPLEKVCFIGQSGTGKTTLLNVIWEFFRLTDDAYQVLKKRSVIHNDYNSYDAFYHSISISVEDTDKRATYNGNLPKDEENYKLSRDTNSVQWLKETKFWESYDALEKACLFIEDGVVNESFRFLQKKNSSDGQLMSTTQIATEEHLIQAFSKQEEERQVIIRSKAVGVSYALANLFWQYILSDIKYYSERFRKFTAKLSQEADQFTPKVFYDKFTTWKKENPNPLDNLAQKCLDPLLEKIFLKVDLESSGDTILLKTTSGNQIDGKLSTGTKQLIATSIPIYKLNTKGTVILFDEPERSLFPDIQRILVKHYTSLAPEAQFFFATHSPIIASAFEPCERFILYFDENGEVKCREGVSPEGDDPNDILRQDFGMAPLMLDKGVEEYQRYLDLSTKILNQDDIDRRMELIAERSELGNKYNFSTTDSDETN